MALPGEQDSAYPDAYLTKVPGAVRRRETRWAETSADTPLPARPSFVMREDDVLYFDYGAVRLGRKPDAPDGEEAARIVCVGWLPAWAFTINPRGLADIKPEGYDDKKDERRGPGVLGLLNKLVSDDDGPRRPLLFSKSPAVRAEDLSSADPKAWAEAVPFHLNLKVLRPVQVYMHVFDGGVGHKYCREKDPGGTVVVTPFRTPARVVGQRRRARGPAAAARDPGGAAGIGWRRRRAEAAGRVGGQGAQPVDQGGQVAPGVRRRAAEGMGAV